MTIENESACSGQITFLKHFLKFLVLILIQSSLTMTLNLNRTNSKMSLWIPKKEFSDNVEKLAQESAF
jgi:hypothetical protein